VLQLGRDVETNTKPRLVLVSGLKANALAQVELNLSFAENLLESYGQDANANWLLEETEIHLILVANPDGSSHSLRVRNRLSQNQRSCPFSLKT